nr:putative protein s-acyltransferase 4 [Quercus suber]
MNKFRSFVNEQEHMVVASLTPNNGESFVSSKEKIDIEMGTKRVEGSGFSLPEILRNLDYDDLVDNIKSTEEERTPAFDSLLSVEQEPKESVPSSIGMQSSSFGDEARSIQISSTGDGVGESDQLFIFPKLTPSAQSCRLLPLSLVNGHKTGHGNWLVHLGADKTDFLFLKLQ